MHVEKTLATVWIQLLNHLATVESIVVVVVNCRSFTCPPVPVPFIYCPLSLLSVRPRQELVAVELIVHVWTVAEGPSFHHFTQGQGMEMQMCV